MSSFKEFLAEGFAKVLKKPKTRVIGAGIVGGGLASIASIPIVLKLQKHSSRVGRFMARKELEENPKNFVYYDDKQLEQVKDVKSDKNKSLFKRLFKNFIFLPKAIKETFDYTKYKKTEFQEKKKLKEELKNVELKPGQIEEAKNLQGKVFKAFDKIDEMSQRYSEDMEAATNIGMQSLPVLSYVAIFTPFILLGAGIAKGKVTLTSVTKKISGLMAKVSMLAKTGTFKKYVNEVAQTIEKKGEKISEPGNPLGEMLISGFFEGKSKENMVEGLEGIKKFLKTDGAKNLEEMLDAMPAKQAGIFEAVLSGVQKDSSSVEKIINNLQKVIKNLPEKEYNNLRDTMAKNPQVILECIKSPSLSREILMNKTALGIYKTGARTWMGANLAGYILIMMYLAELQKQAGKVGTMKAIQSLEDPRCFVDKHSASQSPDANNVSVNTKLAEDNKLEATSGNKMIDQYIKKQIAT